MTHKRYNSCLGAFGIEQFTPCINPSECCILVLGAIKKEYAIGENDLPVVRKRFQMTLVFNNRIVGAVPVTEFLKDLKVNLENPGLLLCE